MAKPIFLIGIPYLDQKTMSDMHEALGDKMPDYYSLVYSTNMDEAQFRVIYEKDFDEVRYEELKKIISEMIMGKK